jgi:fatty acid desaturase
VRDIAEHGMVPSLDDPLRNTRTTRAGFLARLALAPYWVNHHLEHHLLAFVPCWKLPQVHALLLAKGLGGEWSGPRATRDHRARDVGVELTSHSFS